MLKITLFGVGCSKHRQLASNLEAAIKNYSDIVFTEEVSDVDSFVNYSVGAIPALAIDNKVLTKGIVPTIEEIQNFISNFLKKENLKKAS